ncbi:MAG: GNAT family N-acetyltransferase [Acidimicrobiaceae bacterium]|nr:GNAT family N-acetyltransferase [Acidimicrobiaceae bacterium]
MTSNEFPHLLVRPWEVADVPELKQLQARFFSEISLLRGGEELARTVRLPSSGAISSVQVVGVLEGCIVGYCSISFQSEDAGTVDQIYVEPEARRIGIAEAMLEAVVELAQTKGLRNLDALALPGAREAKNLLEGLGFKARLLVLNLPLRSLTSKSQ